MPENEPRVLFEDNHVLALFKPAGLLTQGVPAGLPTLEAWARDYLKVRYSKPGRAYLGIPHRLDRPVSGVILFARSTKSARRLAEQFQNHRVEKVYWAVTDGPTPDGEVVWEDWLLKQPAEARSAVVTAETPGAKLARTRVRRLANGDNGTALELRPTTGRMHQLRVQAASRGCPIRGDRDYGSVVPFGPPAASPRDRWIALHARAITFLHPIRYEPMTVTADLPEVWSQPFINWGLPTGGPTDPPGPPLK